MQLVWWRISRWEDECNGNGFNHGVVSECCCWRQSKDWSRQQLKRLVLTSDRESRAEKEAHHADRSMVQALSARGLSVEDNTCTSMKR